MISVGVFTFGACLWVASLKYGRPLYAETHPPYLEEES